MTISEHPINTLQGEPTSLADFQGKAGDVTWNFEKFLVSPDGEVVARFRPQVEPEDPTLVEAVEQQLPS